MEIRPSQDLLINMPYSLKKQMVWRKFMNANKMRTKKSIKRPIELSKRKLFQEESIDVLRYFGDEEDVADESLAPEQQAGQFTFGSTNDQTGEPQQFSFGEDVTMT